jgi:hypothetical protein
MTLLSTRRLFPIAATLILMLPKEGFGQLDRGALSGTVNDQTGRVLAGVRIAAVKNDTGLRRETTSSESGAYELPELPVGRYTVKFNLAGFQEVSITNATLTIGQTNTLNVRINAAGASEHIEISGTSSDLNQTSDSLGARIERKQVDGLPMNGRNWATLTALAPGAIDAGGSNQRTVRFAGRGLDDNNFTSDGIDATNIVNQAQQPFVRLAIPSDTIQEFRVESMLFTTEAGSTPGGQVAVTTPSGTNQFHADIFEFTRNNLFDARNPFDTNSSPAPFHLNQFGVSASGPIVPGKTFFFVSYEGFRQLLEQPLQGFVPTDGFRAQIVAQSPALAGMVNSYPRGQLPVNAQISRFRARGDQVDTENSGMIRIDQRITDSTTAFVRFNIDDAVSSIPQASSGQTLNDRQNTNSRPANAVIEVLHVLSPTATNEAKFGFNRGTVFTDNVSQTGLPFSISVSGFTALNNNQQKTGVGNSFSLIDNFTWVKDRHVIKSGIEVRRIQLQQGNTESGSVSYSSPAAFAANQVNTAAFAAALPVNGLRKTELYAYIQDEFKLKPNLTLNLGVRYQFFDQFHEVLGRAVPFDFASCGAVGFCATGASFGRPNFGDVDPRIAVAWTPAAFGGRTVLRSGFGIYHGDGQLDDQNLPIANEVQRYSLSQATIPGLSFPIEPFLANTPGIVSPRDMDRNRKDMYVAQWGASIQQSLPGELVATVSYIGSKGTHLLTTSYLNTIDPATGVRQFPAFGQVEFRGNENNSSFQGLQGSLQRSFSHGLLVSFNYLWSHEIDDGSLGGGEAEFPENPGCRACDRASGDFDARQTAHASVVYQLPFGSGQRFLNQGRIVRGLVGGWQLASIVGGRSGLPVNVTVDRPASAVPTGNTQGQRPDLVPGVPLTPPGGSTPSLWINPAAFAVPAPGTFGNAGRNIVRGPRIWQIDLALSRRVALGERAGLEFRAEGFNVLNHPQRGAPQADISAGPGAFGAILTTVNTGPVGAGTPRQLQFMARLSF